MRAIRVVGLTEDGDVVLEDPVRLERYTVPADERLRAAARGDLSRLGQIAIELESQLRPREIQARIRAGASVEQVAAAAGVPEQKIERFAYPVLLERSRTADVAQRAHPMRADGPDGRTLGEVVAHTFGLRGHTYEGARWDAWKGEDGRWVVALSWRAGRSDNSAHWTFQPGAHGGTVTALDEHASDLVEGLPARPLRTVGPVIDMARPEEEPPPAPPPVEQWRAAASDGYRERMPATPDAGRPVVDRGRAAAEPWRASAPRQPEPAAESRAPEPASSEAGDRTRAGADWAPWQRTADAEADAAAQEQSAPAQAQGHDAAHPTAEAARSTAAAAAVASPDAEATSGSAPVDPAAGSAADRSEPAPSGTPEPVAPEETPRSNEAAAAHALEADVASAAEPAPPGEVPPVPADETAPAAPTPNRRTKKGKPVMPSWDEVLLGVRGPR
jgi:Protein of unknown function (DUF3071)